MVTRAEHGSVLPFARVSEDAMYVDMHRGPLAPADPPGRGTGEPWRRTAIGLALGIRLATLLLLLSVLKDWVVSAYAPGYPLVASAATSVTAAIAVIAPFVVRRPSRWHDIVLAGSALAVLAHLAGLVPTPFGIAPGVPVLAGAFAVSRLLVGERVSERRQAALVAVFGLGVVALVHRPESNTVVSAWGIATAIAATAPVVAIVRLSRAAPPSRLRTAVILAVAAAPALLFVLSMRPLARIPVTRLALAGLGLGWQNPGTVWHRDLFALATARPSLTMLVVLGAAGVGLACLHTGCLTLRRRLAGIGVLVMTQTVFAPAPVAMTTGPGGGGGPPGYAAASSAVPFVVTLAREQGLFVVALVLLLFLLAALTVAVVVARWRAGAARDEHFALATGTAGTLAGMVVAASIASPFLTGDSALGTAAFAAALASLAPALDPRVDPTPLERRVPGPDCARRRRRILAAAVVVLLGVAITLIAWQRSARHQVLPLVGSGPPPGYHAYVPLDRISAAMQAATIAHENPYFYETRGFEWRSIFDVLRRNVRQARITGGGSGITQQLAKNLFLTSDRTLSRKLREAMLTIQLEALLSKERILEIYLNTIDYGMGQRGIAAAARFYFDTTPDALDVAQSATLVGLVPNPPQHRLSLHDLRVGQEMGLFGLRDRWPADYGNAVLADARAVPIESRLRVPLSVIGRDEPSLARSTPERVVNLHRGRWVLIVGTTAALVLLGWLFARAVVRPVGERHDTTRRREAFVFIAAALTSGALAIGWWWERGIAERAGGTILARYVASPNWNQRPVGAGVYTVVLHSTVDEDPSSVVRFFEDFTASVSAHFVVDKIGRVVQIVPIEGRAWHAGQSELGEATDVNHISVGIEMVNRNDGIDPYPLVQYEAVARLIRRLQQRYPISLDRIVSHAEVARPVGRKSDPLGFDFERLRRLIVRGVP